MNFFLTTEEKRADPTLGTVHAAILPTAPNEKAVAALLESAENAEQKRRVVRNVAVSIMWLKVMLHPVGIICLAASQFLGHLKWLELTGLGTIVFAVLPIGIFSLFIRKRGSPNKRLQTVVADLVQFPDDPRFMLPFIDALYTAQTTEEKSKTYLFLTERLWSLPANEAALSLDETRRAALRNTLANGYGKRSAIKQEANAPDHFDDVTADLTVAIMKTLAKLGDKKTEKVLQKIIKAEAITPNETVVRDAAREYLLVLTQKITEKEHLQTRILQCLGGSSARDGQQMLSDYLDTFAPEDAKAALVDLLYVRRKNYSASTNVIRCVTLPYAALCLYNSVAQGKTMDIFVVVAVFFQIYFAVPNLIAQHHRSDNGKLIYELAKRSGNDTRLIPLLLTAVPIFLAINQMDAVRKALARLLPLLQPGDAALVPPTQRAYLHSWLKLPRNRRNKNKAGSGSKTLTIAALDALAAIGDTKSLGAAEEIAQQTLRGNYYESELHEAAVRCVEALRAREK